MNDSPHTSSHNVPAKTLAAIFGSLLTLVVIALSLFFCLRPQPAPEEISTPGLAIPGDTKPYHFDYSWSDQHRYVAHAMGGILGDTYTNSYEAFLLNYQLGHRIFEVDFQITDDTEVVIGHDRIVDEATQTFTANTYLSTLDKGKYHHLDYNHLIQIMITHPDIYIVTDSKYSDPENTTAQFTALVAAAEAVDSKLLDRFIIQIYTQDMLDTVMAVYPWKSVIYTLYADPSWTPENVLAFAQQSGVKYITMWDHWVTPEIVALWQPAGLKIAAHTVNDLNTVDQLLDLGVSNIYTDFLLP